MNVVIFQQKYGEKKNQKNLNVSMRKFCINATRFPKATIKSILSHWMNYKIFFILMKDYYDV